MSRTGTARAPYGNNQDGNRLTALDAAGRTTYQYDAANQLQTEKLGAGITSYSYDANGNRATQVTGAAITSFTWDEENRLTGIAYPDATLATYLYSADGLRQRKVDSSGTVNYLWDEGRVQQELNEDLVETVRYTQSIWGLDSLVSQYRGGVTSFYGYDLAGNTRQLVDLAGNVTDTYIYETFGVIRTQTGTTINNFDFGGQWGYISAPASLSYARNRIVDSKTGQWLSRDPIGFWGGDANLVRYVGNDPVSGVDPSGLVFGVDDLLILAAAGAAFAGLGNLVGQEVQNYRTGQSLSPLNVNGGDLAIASSVGAVAGVLSPGASASSVGAGAGLWSPGVQSIVKAASLGAVSSGVQYSWTQYTHDAPPFDEGLPRNCAIGAVSGAVAGAYSKPENFYSETPIMGAKEPLRDLAFRQAVNREVRLGQIFNPKIVRNLVGATGISNLPTTPLPPPPPTTPWPPTPRRQRRGT